MSQRLRRTALGILAAGVAGMTAAAEDQLPDAGVARASGQGAVAAWYGRPTTRYPHGVLGDAVEGGSLIVVDEAGKRHELVLSDDYVFEDLAPRLTDLDADGENEVVTIRTDVRAGAAVAVYAMDDGRLVERAATPPIGQANRWLSIAGIGDFSGDGSREIAVVRTPHIGGVLEVLSLRRQALVRLYPLRTGYSSHVIGSRILSLAGVGDVTGDGVDELALPDQARRRLVVVRLTQGVDVVAALEMPARISGKIRIEEHGRIAALLETGETAWVVVR